MLTTLSWLIFPCVVSMLLCAFPMDAHAAAFELGFDVCAAPLTPGEERKLNTRRAALKRQLNALQPNVARGNGKTNVAAARALQEALLEVTERLECKTLASYADPIVRGPAEAKPTFVELTIRFATDRTMTGDSSPYQYFDGTIMSPFRDFTYGEARVSVPTNRQRGELPQQPWWDFIQQPDPNRYFVIRSITLTDRAALLAFMNQPGNDESLLLFVHGFNVTFADASLRTAQLAVDLGFPGKVMFYSWPSVGNVKAYWTDEDTVRISERRFERLLADLLDTGIKRVYVIAHSMGSRIVVPAVAALAARGRDVSKINELILAAADFNALEFTDLARAFAELRAKGSRLTIYAASNDFALKASKIVHSYSRLGESGSNLMTFVDIDSVDASATAPMLRAFGHSYVSDSPQVIGDIQDVITNHFDPAARGLLPVAAKQPPGWRFPRLN